MPATALLPKPRINYPRPPIVVLHADLFKEPVYEDGEPYGQDDEDEDTDA